MIFGGWLELIEDPYRHWQFGFVRNRGVTDCLAIRWAIWERAAKAGWCLSEQQWDIVKAFDMLDGEQLFRDVTAPSAPLITDIMQDLYLQARMHIKKDAYLTRTGVRQGDNLGPGLFRRSYDAATQEWNEQLDARPWARRLVVRYIPMGLPEASIDFSVSGYSDDMARAAVAKNLTELGQISREQTDSLRAALKSRSLQLHLTKGIVLLRAAGRNSMKDYQAACTGAWLAPEHISLQAKYLGALRTIEGTAKVECRARCQAAEASFALNAPFFRSQFPHGFKVLVFKAAIVGTLLAALETAPLDAYDFHHLEVKLCSLARRFLRRKAYVFDVKKLGAAVTRRLALCPPVVIPAKTSEVASEATFLGTVHWTSVPTLAALFGTFLWREPTVKTDGTLSLTAPRLLVIIDDDLEAVGLPLTSPTWNTDLVQGRWSMPSEEPPDENPSLGEDEPVLPPELQHPCDECEWTGRSEGSLRGHKIMAQGYRSQIDISCPQCPQCGKKFATISNARVHIKRQSCSRSKSCNIRSIFYSTRPEQPRPKTVCAPVVSNTAPSVYGAISHGRPAEIRQEAEDSSRGDSVSLATQRSRDSHELPRQCIQESRSLVNNSVSNGPRHRTSFDTDHQGPIYVQRDTDREWTSPEGTTTSHSGQSIGATLPAPFGRPLRQVSRHADQPRGSGTTQREPSRGSEDQKGRQFFLRTRPHTSDVPLWNEAFQMLTHWVRQQPNGEVLYDATPPGTEARHIASRARGHTNINPFFLPLRDSGSTETAVRMSLRCPQVCATGRLERPLQCVVVILRLAARRITLVPHEWTLSYSRGIVVVVDFSLNVL